jgi:hypothetical protein
MNCRSLTTRKLRLLACAIVLSAGLGDSFGVPVPKDTFEPADGGASLKGTVLATGDGGVTMQMSNPDAINAGSKVSGSPLMVLDQATTAAQSASSTVSALPTSSLTTLATLSLSPGVYTLTSSKLDHATLILTGTGYFTLDITNYFALNSAKVLPAGGATVGNLLLTYIGTKEVMVSGSAGPNQSVLRGILLALNAKINLSPGLIVGQPGAAAIVQTAPPPLPLTGARTVPDSGSTITLFCVACVALALVRIRVVRI